MIAEAESHSDNYDLASERLIEKIQSVLKQKVDASYQ